MNITILHLFELAIHAMQCMLAALLCYLNFISQMLISYFLFLDLLEVPVLVLGVGEDVGEAALAAVLPVPVRRHEHPRPALRSRTLAPPPGHLNTSYNIILPLVILVSNYVELQTKVRENDIVTEKDPT